MNDLASIKNRPGGCKVDQIGPWCKIHVFIFVCITEWVGYLGLHRCGINDIWMCF